MTTELSTKMTHFVNWILVYSMTVHTYIMHPYYFATFHGTTRETKRIGILIYLSLSLQDWEERYLHPEYTKYLSEKTTPVMVSQPFCQ